MTSSEAAEPTPASRADDIGKIWWLDPGRLLLSFVLPLYFLIVVAAKASRDLVVLRAPDFMDWQYVLLGAACIAAMGWGALVGARLRVARPAAQFIVNERFLLIAGCITIVAYLIWFAPLLLFREAIETILSSPDKGDREAILNRIPGVTSFSQLGVIFILCYMYATLHARQRLGRAVTIVFWTVIFLTVARVYVWEERLALIEIIVPALVIALPCVRPRKGFLWDIFRLFIKYGPFFAIPCLLVFFGVTEMFRSWSYYEGEYNFSDFVVSRVATYYYTALNNGAGLLDRFDWPAYKGTFLMEWLYQAPFGIGAAIAKEVGIRESPADRFLTQFADPEFNNMSGIFPPFYDVGILGGFCYFILLGLLAGTLYRRFRLGTRAGILLFPTLFTACMELLRVLYLNNPRTIVIYLGAALAATQLKPRSAIVA